MGACSGASQKEMVEGQPADPQLPAGDPVRRAREPIVRKRQLVEELPIAQLPAKQPKAVPLLPASWRATDAVQEMGPTTKAKGESHAKSLSATAPIAGPAAVAHCRVSHIGRICAGRGQSRLRAPMASHMMQSTGLWLLGPTSAPVLLLASS